MEKDSIKVTLSLSPEKAQKVDRQPCLPFWKLGGTRSEHMIKLNQEICHYLLNHNISITAGYLPSVLSIIVNRESKKTKTKQNKKNRHFRVSSWSQSFPSGFWTTRFSNNRSICFLPMSLTTSIYSLASRSLQSGDRCKPELLNLSVREPVLLLQGKETLISPKNIIHLLMVENSLTLATWLVSGKPLRVKGFQKTLLILSQIPDEKTLSLIVSHPMQNGLAGVLNEKLILIRHL